ncbi:hypothetical protein MOKP126_37580 [Mycobacterium avium subsp. hominissuis]
MLNGVDPPGGKRAAVAGALHDEHRALLGVPGPQEVSVQRVHLVARVDRAHRRHQRLAGHMAAEGALEISGIRAEDAPAVDVDLELLEIKDLLDRHGLFLPAAFRQPFGLRDLLDVDADHRLAQPA